MLVVPEVNHRHWLGTDPWHRARGLTAVGWEDQMTCVTSGYRNITECEPHVCQDQLDHTRATNSVIPSSQCQKQLNEYA